MFSRYLVYLLAACSNVDCQERVTVLSMVALILGNWKRRKFKISDVLTECVKP